MRVNVVFVTIGIGMAIAGVGGSAGDALADTRSEFGSSLVRVTERRIFFGHQSVGANILDGLKDLTAEHGVSLRILETTSAAALQPGTFAHAFLASNGDPVGKLESFEAALGAASDTDPDIALVKFCFVDFSSDTDASKIFAAYDATIARLKLAHPRTVFVHVTAPLTTAEHGLKDRLKQILGRATSSAANARREEFNELMRSSYGGREPVFDLARAESTTPDGKREFGRWKGRDVPALAPAYTNDGGHLNVLGRRQAALALVSVLGAVRRTP